MQTARRAHALAPDNAFINDTLGWILVERGAPVLGLRYLREAHSRNAGLTAARLHIAHALHRLGRNEAARRELEALLKSYSNFPERDEAMALLERL